ncbi:zinc finger, CCHC-type containing protein [Tanacetum coccineum]
MGDENPIRTLGDYSKPSHEGYKNTIELPVGNNVDFLKLVDSLDLDGENRERMRLTTKLRNDILMFQQHHGESLSEAWTRFKDLLQKVPHHGIDLWLQVQIFYDHVNPVTRRTIDQSAGVVLTTLSIAWKTLNKPLLTTHPRVPMKREKDPETPLLVGRGFLATTNAVIDCRMAKIVVGEEITRSIFDVKGVDIGEEEAPYRTTLGKRESYKP